MSTKGLFANEEAIIAAAQARLAEPFGSDADKANFDQLLKDYEKLLKITWRFMRLSDRNENELAASVEREKLVKAELTEKNAELEAISNKLGKYLSPQVYASLFAEDNSVELASKRKKITVFFSDLHGFTQITDRLESEDLTDLVNSYLTEMAEIALEYGATIDKYMGDAVLIFFGDPETRGVKEDALACIEMGLAMQARLKDLSENWRNHGFDQHMTSRMGVHTGYCTVGNFGSKDRMDYTIVGGNVNLASRLEKVCPPGGLLMSYETYALVKDEILCEPQGEVRPNGLAYPVDTYLAVARCDAAEAGDRAMTVDLPNLQMNADFRAMNRDELQKARSQLRQALEALDARKFPLDAD